MAKNSDATNQPASKEFSISRVFDASRDLVWKAWTERSRMMKWFGPKGSKMTKADLDLRPGGMFHYCLRGSDGKEMWGKVIYREIVKPEKIVQVQSFSDEKGGLVHHPMSPTWPLEMLSTTTFTEDKGKTTVTVKWVPVNASAAETKTFNDNLEGMKMGWTGSFDQLAEYLSNNKA